jgi:hypothetical protein
MTHPLSITDMHLLHSTHYINHHLHMQGMTFGKEPWLLHLNMPPNNVLLRASIYVVLTRYTEWDDIHLLAPLWTNAVEELAIKQAFHDAATFTHSGDQALLQEWERLEQLDADTRYLHHWQLHNTSTCQLICHPGPCV